MTTTTDADLIYSTLADDPVIGELVELYAAEMPERIAALVARWDARDYAALTTLAHQMKGAAGSHGFTQLTPLAARVEKLAREARAESEIQTAVDELVAACGRVRYR
jgi:HPt (histidine-containing phosphotransfer) domain-containing protein